VWGWTLLYTLIHPSAWNTSSPKLNFRFTEFSEVGGCSPSRRLLFFGRVVAHSSAAFERRSMDEAAATTEVRVAALNLWGWRRV
jgi:hypothetical protein